MSVLKNTFGYPDHDSNGGSLRDGTGKTIARCRVTGSSPIRPGSRGEWISSHRVSYRCETPDGRQWVGRGYGKGMSLNLRAAKTRGKV